MRVFIIIFTLLLFMSPSTYAQQPSNYELYNPDGTDKYRFVRSFISGLEYFYNVSSRIREQSVTEEVYYKETDLPKKHINSLITDNMDLRVAKNYLRKYLDSDNLLMRKVANDVMAVYEGLIQVNEQERSLWQDMYQYRANSFELTMNFKEFNNNLQVLLRERLRLLKMLPQQAIMVTKVMRTELAEEPGYEHLLALTQEERDRLIQKLDEYAAHNLDWGLKEGQSAVAASVATLREVLEDSLWVSKDAE